MHTKTTFAKWPRWIGRVAQISRRGGPDHAEWVARIVGVRKGRANQGVYSAAIIHLDRIWCCTRILEIELLQCTDDLWDTPTREAASQFVLGHSWFLVLPERLVEKCNGLDHPLNR